MYYGKRMNMGGVMTPQKPSVKDQAIAAYWERLKDEYGIPSTEGYDYADFLDIAMGRAPKPKWWDSSYAMDAVVEMKDALESMDRLASGENKGVVAFDTLGGDMSVLDGIYNKLRADDPDFKRVKPIYSEARKISGAQ